MKKQKTLPQKLKEYRELKGLSQFDFTVRLKQIYDLDVSRDTVKNWERGRNKPKIQTLPLLLELMDKAGIR